MTTLLVVLLVAINAGYALRAIFIAKRSTGYLLSREYDGTANSAQMLSIIVPARNEERQIERCVRSLLAQRHPEFEVIVVDDRSDDETPSILARIAASDARLRVITGDALPEGWIGKPWALTQGASAARGEWLLFTDADTWHEPDASQSALAYAHAHRLDVVSLLTQQVMITPAERVILPSILFTIGFAIGSLRAINDPRRRGAAVFNGQYILMHRRAHEGIGGHAAVKGEIAEDYELAKRFKNDGRFRTALVDSNALVHTRMYRSFAEIWHGFVKNLALGARGQELSAAAGLAFFAAVAPLTPLAVLVALAAHRPGAALALVGAMILAICGAEIGMRRYGIPAGSGVWLPAGMSMLIAVFFASMFAHARGGVTWRGRRY